MSTPRIPASVRNLNPGAQWPGPISRRWGSTSHEALRDGQGNLIATFPSWEQGAAAHIDLLRSSPRYAGKTLNEAIRTWSGGNHWQGYVDRVSRETGLRPDTVINDDLLRSPQGLALVKSMAGHEKGPNGEGVPEAAWEKARAMVFGGEPQPQGAFAPPTTAVAAATPEQQPTTGQPPKAPAQAAYDLASAVFNPSTDSAGKETKSPFETYLSALASRQEADAKASAESASTAQQSLSAMMASNQQAAQRTAQAGLQRPVSLFRPNLFADPDQQQLGAFA